LTLGVVNTIARALITGSVSGSLAPEPLPDLMKIGALTGARIDAIASSGGMLRDHRGGEVIF